MNHSETFTLLLRGLLAQKLRLIARRHPCALASIARPAPLTLASSLLVVFKQTSGSPPHSEQGLAPPRRREENCDWRELAVRDRGWVGLPPRPHHHQPRGEWKGCLLSGVARVLLKQPFSLAHLLFWPRLVPSELGFE